MLLESRDIVDQPLSVVYELVRDDLPALVPYLPNVERIDVKEASREDERHVRRVNHWFAKAEMPSLVKKFMKPELFSWLDTARWDDEQKLVEYELTSQLGKEIFTAKGRNWFREIEPGKTEIHVTCDIEIHADKVPGIPTLMARTVIPAVEGILKVLIQPNLTSLAKGLKGYFAQKAAN